MKITLTLMSTILIRHYSIAVLKMLKSTLSLLSMECLDSSVVFIFEERNSEYYKKAFLTYATICKKISSVRMEGLPQN